jgi:hypothetical protein
VLNRLAFLAYCESNTELRQRNGARELSVCAAAQGLTLNVIAVGDCRISSETDHSMSVRRLVRDFDVNSRDDFANVVSENAVNSERYSDIDLTHLPAATALGAAQRAAAAIPAPPGSLSVAADGPMRLYPWDSLSRGLANLLFLDYPRSP